MSGGKWRVVTVAEVTKHRHETSFRFTEEEAQAQVEEARKVPFTVAYAEKKETT